MIAALAGGTGAAKLLRGLAAVTDPRRLCVIGNTGDDLTWWGLHVAPDLDTVTYALAGVLDPVRGWGVRDDTFGCLETMARLGRPAWFRVGDRDLAVHLLRTDLLRAGAPLSQATAVVARALGVAATILPMSDDPVRTRIRTPQGWLDFQEFFVRERAAPEVLEVAYLGAQAARPAPGVLEALGDAELVVVCCSNPVTSIGPILAVPGVVEALGATRAPVVAVSPLVGGAPVSGPAGRFLQACGLPVSPLALAELYHPWLDVLLLDPRDAALGPELARRGIRPATASVVMTDLESARSLARAVLAAGGVAP